MFRLNSKVFGKLNNLQTLTMLGYNQFIDCLKYSFLSEKDVFLCIRLEITSLQYLSYAICPSQNSIYVLWTQFLSISWVRDNVTKAEITISDRWTCNKKMSYFNFFLYLSKKSFVSFLIPFPTLSRKLLCNRYFQYR